MGNNEMMAMANAREIETLPYETQGEKWYRKFIGHRTNEITGKEETYAAGEWRADLNGQSFENPTMANMWAQMTYSKGHYKVYAFVPELHKVSNQIVNE